MTRDELFEDIAERVTTARARALMGERKEARTMLQQARIDFLRHREALKECDGLLALEGSLLSAQAALEQGT